MTEITAAQINSTEFPRDKKLERLAELEEKLSGEYVGGMTEYWQRCKDFLLSQKGQKIADVLDGPEQKCYPTYITTDGDFYVTNPVHGGKVTCHKCNGFIKKKDSVPYLDHQHRDDFPRYHFHKDCYNPYEHYYGIDKPID